MGKIFKKAIVFAITASFVFNSGLGQMLSYAQTSDIYKNAKSIISNFAAENIAQANYSVATASNASTSSYSLTSDNFTYTVDNSEVTIIAYTGEDTKVTIPSEIDGMKVTAIGSKAFYYMSSLTSITIPEGVTYIGESAFQGCYLLTSMTIPKSVTTIDVKAFCECTGLKSITIPDSVTTISERAFSYCSSLTSITLSGGITTIAENTFYRCTELTGITIPEGVTTISDSAFYECTSLESVDLPKSLTTIGSSAFYYCLKLMSITIPEGITTIAENAFSACVSLKSINLPKSLTTIENSAFNGCSSLESITLPENVISIGKSAFYYCKSLKSITIPEGVTSIEEFTFYECNSLESITLPENVMWIGASAFRGCKSLKSMTIPEYVTSIEQCTFYGCSSLESITIPEGVTKIGQGAFYGCSSLANITIPKDIIYINRDTFRGCSSLKSITIPEGVTYIDEYAFSGCKSLANITIPNNVTGIARYAFSECSSLTNIDIPNNVKSIGDGIFNNCTSLTSITLSKNISYIPWEAFSGCILLNNITLPQNMSTIGSYAFQGCSSLTSINIPKNVGFIGSSAFQGCSSLTSINIPKAVYDIGDSAFQGCSSLSTNIKIPEGVEYIKTSTFEGCTNLKEIYIPNSVKIIWDKAFANCTNLMLHVYKDSIAETYAINNKIPYKYRDYENAIVILPGVMGSRLFSDTDGYEEDSLIWEPIAKLENIDGIVETYYNINGLSDRLLGNTYVKPPQIQQFLEAHEDSQEFFGLTYREYGALDTYKNLVDELCKSTERPVYFFSYNWMQSNSDSADKLREFLEPFDQVDLVCHSMGGIVASSYMSKYKSDGKVDKIVTCGTPYEGSPAIINKMQNWDVVEDNDNFIFTKSKFKDVFSDVALGLLGGLTKQTKTKITTAAELVPSENYVSRVPMYKRGLLFREELSLDEYKTICKNIFKEKYDDGLIFQEAIKGSTGYNNLLDYENAYFLIGTNRKTITSIVFDKSDDIGSLLYEKDLKYETKGDGTVPYISSTMSQAVKRLPEDRYCFADGDHTQIVQKSKTIEWIKEKLEIDYETSTSSDDTTLSQEPIGGIGYRVLSVACPVDVNIEANGEVLSSSASEFDTETSFGRLDIIGQNDDIKMACLDDIDDYDVTLKGTGEGTMDYTIRYFNSDDELQSETTINDVPITKDTIITTKPVSTKDTVLNVDIDGDGTVDKTYTAPKGETVDVEKVVKFNPNNGDQEIKRAVDSEGKLNYTPEAPTREGYTFVGWFKDTDDITTEYKSGATYTEDVTYTAKWAHVDMLGAQVKAVVDDKSGIRFGTKIYNDGDEIVEKGTIILPVKLLPDGESLTLDTPNIAQSVGKVNYEVNEEKNYVTYLGTLINIPRSQFDAEITASAYVIYKDKAGNEYTVYAPYKKGSTTINKLLNS